MAFERKPHPELHPPYLWHEPQENYYTLLYQFFDYTSLSYCHLHLKELTEGAFADSYLLTAQPGNLLYFYERLLILLYALNGLLKENKQHNTVTEPIAVAEKDLSLPEVFKPLPWQSLPHHLSLTEINRPFTVVSSFFEFLSFDEWVLELHDWLGTALGNSTITECTEQDRLLPICTHLYKIIEAAWVIHKQSEGIPAKADASAQAIEESHISEEIAIKDTSNQEKETGKKNFCKPSPMYFFFSDRFKDLQAELVKRISEVTQVQKIFLLGSTFSESRTETLFSGVAPTARKATHCYLLVLVPKTETATLSQLQDKIEAACAHIIATTAIVLHTEQFYDWLWHGDLFAYRVQKTAIQLYSDLTNPQEDAKIS